MHVQLASLHRRPGAPATRRRLRVRAAHPVARAGIGYEVVTVLARAESFGYS